MNEIEKHIVKSMYILLKSSSKIPEVRKLQKVYKLYLEEYCNVEAEISIYNILLFYSSWFDGFQELEFIDRGDSILFNYISFKSSNGYVQTFLLCTFGDYSMNLKKIYLKSSAESILNNLEWYNSELLLKLYNNENNRRFVSRKHT